MLTSTKNVFDELGDGYTLLSIGTQATSRDLWLHASKMAKVPLKIIHQEIGSDLDRYEASWVLVRPDQFVAWTCEEPEVTPSLINGLLEHLKG
jgi:hypothetical protein